MSAKATVLGMLLPALLLTTGCATSGGGGGGGGETATSSGGDAAAGKTLFQANGCGGCHGDPGMGNATFAGASDLGGNDPEQAQGIEDMLTWEAHPGGTFEQFTRQDYENLAAFFAQGDSEGNGEGPGEGDSGDTDGGGGSGEDTDDLTGGEPILRDFSIPIPLFSSDSAWRQRADNADVLPESADQMLVFYRVLLGDNTSLHPPFEGDFRYPFMGVNIDAFTIPVFAAGNGVQSVRLEDYDGVPEYPNSKWPVDFGDGPEAGLGGPVSTPAPAGDIRPAGPVGLQGQADGHLVLLDLGNLMEYDFWTATTAVDAEGNSLGGGQVGTSVIAAGAADFFDMTGPGTNPDDVSSARAAGTPLLAGLLLPEDVASGAIEHALACAIPRNRNLATDPTSPTRSDYFYPTSTTETEWYNTNPLALASGQRLRLRNSIVNEEGQTIDESTLAPITRMYLTALRDYGLYIVDNAEGFTFYAEDIHTGNLDLPDDGVNELIGQPAGTALPGGKTKWHIVLDKLNDDLETIPVASGAWWEADPATATFGVANFDVVENASVP